eukprot:scaffold116097_cov37-Tisochrysis_lutea.AAC.1
MSFMTSDAAFPFISSPAAIPFESSPAADASSPMSALESLGASVNQNEDDMDVLKMVNAYEKGNSDLSMNRHVVSSVEGGVTDARLRAQGMCFGQFLSPAPNYPVTEAASTPQRKDCGASIGRASSSSYVEPSLVDTSAKGRGDIQDATPETFKTSETHIQSPEYVFNQAGVNAVQVEAAQIEAARVNALPVSQHHTMASGRVRSASVSELLQMDTSDVDIFSLVPIDMDNWCQELVHIGDPRVGDSWRYAQRCARPPL